jgi:hypothetical protein
MKAKEFDERIENEDLFDLTEVEEVSIKEIVKKSFSNSDIYFLIKEKASKLNISVEKMAEILLAERLGLI